MRDGAKLKSTQKNRFLEELLEQKGENTREVWDSIMRNDGSVQHLDFLSDGEKAVFMTFAEIPQMAIIKQAAQRQKYIDQSQSLNISIDPDNVSIKDINQLYIEAWQSGVKSLYYQNSVNAAQKLVGTCWSARLARDSLDYHSLGYSHFSYGYTVSGNTIFIKAGCHYIIIARRDRPPFGDRTLSRFRFRFHL